MKRILTILTGLTFAILMIAWWWCEQEPELKSDRVTIRWVVNSQDSEQRFAQLVCDAFEKSQSTVHVQLIKQNEGAKVDTMIAGGDAPDVLAIEYTRAPYYVDAGAILDLKPLMSQVDMADLSNYFPATRIPYEIGGHIYGVPWGYVPFVLYYNRSMYDNAHLAYPNSKWTWADYRRTAKSLTSPPNTDPTHATFGATFAAWQEGYYSWFAQNGATIWDERTQSAKFNSQNVVETVDFLHTLTQVDRSMPTDTNRPKTAGGLFESGKLGMNGPAGSFYIPTYRNISNLDWDIASVPSGPVQRATVISPLAFGIPSRSKHHAEAWSFVKFLTGLGGERLLAQSDLFVPAMRNVALSNDYLRRSGPPANRYALIEMLDDRDGRKPWGFVPKVGGVRWADVNDDALNATLGGYLFGSSGSGKSASTVCNEIQDLATGILSSQSQTDHSSPLPVRGILYSSIACLILGAGILAFVFFKKPLSKTQRVEALHGYVAIAPWLIGFVCLSIAPILFNLLISLTHWNSLSSISHARWVGADNFQVLFSGKDQLFTKSLAVTFTYAAIAIPLNVFGGLCLALLLNTRTKTTTLFRAIYYLPAILPGVATAVLFRWLLSKQGLVNYLMSFGGLIPQRYMPDWLHNAAWTLPSMTTMSLWMIGSGTMIYLAGLQNVPTHLYEAAQLDGANSWSKFKNITLPMITPVLLFNLITRTIGAFQVFSNAFVLYGGGTGPDNSALFYAFYLYRKAFEQFQAGYAAALSWILFIIILVLSLLIIRSSSMWVYYEGKREDTP
ncbi:MAG: extracellular solute-binding protein [Chthonomonadales bacterium]